MPVGAMAVAAAVGHRLSVGSEAEEPTASGARPATKRPSGAALAAAALAEAAGQTSRAECSTPGESLRPLRSARDPVRGDAVHDFRSAIEGAYADRPGERRGSASIVSVRVGAAADAGRRNSREGSPRRGKFGIGPGSRLIELAGEIESGFDEQAGASSICGHIGLLRLRRKVAVTPPMPGDAAAAVAFARPGDAAEDFRAAQQRVLQGAPPASAHLGLPSELPPRPKSPGTAMTSMPSSDWVIGG